MAKKNDNSPRSQYERILGAPLSDFDIVCFRFPDWGKQRVFDYLALNHNLRGLLYDSVEETKTTTIVFDKGSQNCDKARTIAVEEMGAKEIKPQL